MKRCSVCHRIYTDDSLVFCLQDGANLIEEISTVGIEPATLSFSEPSERVQLPSPTRRLTPASPLRKAVPWLITGAAIMFAIGIGLTALLFIFYLSRQTSATIIKPAATPVPAPVHSPTPTAEDIIGTWRTNVTEFGERLQIDITFNQNGSSEYIIKNAKGRTFKITGGSWNYSKGILYENFRNGTSGKGSFQWLDQNNVILTIIDNGDSKYSGLKRQYRRIY